MMSGVDTFAQTNFSELDFICLTTTHVLQDIVDFSEVSLTDE